SIVGISKHSTGLSQSGLLKQSGKENNPALKFQNEENIPYHKDLLYLHTSAILIGECFYQVRDHFPEESARFNLTIEAIVRNSLLELKNKEKEQFELGKEILKRIAELHYLNKLKSEIDGYTYGGYKE